MLSDKSKKYNSVRDRRVFARLPVNLSLRFLEKGRGKKRKDTARTVDICAIGISFISNERLLPNTPLEIWLDMPDHPEPLHIIGKVIWSKNLGQKWRTGVHIERVKLIDLGRIYQRKSSLT